MVIGSIVNGIVLDHIQAGLGMKIYELLNLGELSCQVALIKNADSVKLGKKDIIKIDEVIDFDFNVLAVIDSNITVNVIKDSKLVKRCRLELPQEITDIFKCKNPRCITSTEQELPHVFRLSDKDKHTYRCIYCESRGFLNR